MPSKLSAGAVEHGKWQRSAGEPDNKRNTDHHPEGTYRNITGCKIYIRRQIKTQQIDMKNRLLWSKMPILISRLIRTVNKSTFPFTKTKEYNAIKSYHFELCSCSLG